MIDLHTHSLFSDGALLPCELVRRCEVMGYRAVAITDHVDGSNLETVISQLLKVSRDLNGAGGTVLIPGVEITHIPPQLFPEMVRRAREAGARLVVAHGESIAEPVAPGTNMAAIKAGVDILAHPGLIACREARLAAKNSVMLEVSTRKGHCLTNGHVVMMAYKCNARLVLNTDSHAPSDLVTEEMAESVARGAGLDNSGFKRMKKNAKELLRKIQC